MKLTNRAGKLTPRASVEVVVKIRIEFEMNRLSTILRSSGESPALWKAKPTCTNFCRFLSEMWADAS